MDHGRGEDGFDELLDESFKTFYDYGGQSYRLVFVAAWVDVTLTGPW